MKSRIIMDVDDVISIHRNRDYENAIPNMKVINKMQELAENGIEFVLFTARGQISCNGDIERIVLEKGPTLRKWLARYKVPYSELRFGKPLGDVYVDDAAMTPDEFVYGNFSELNGGSNKYVEQLGKYVVKESSEVDALAVNDWYNIASENNYNVPNVYARTYNKMRMEFISGRAGHTIPFVNNTSLSRDIAMIALSFASVPGEYTFDIKEYAKFIEKNIVGKQTDVFVKHAIHIMLRHAGSIQPTFCHGDLTAMNTIVKGNGKVYMIDPVIHPLFSSYMIDLAKLRMSLNGYNQLFYMGRPVEDDRSHLMTLDNLLNNLRIINLVKVLEYTCWVRLIRYRHEKRDEFNKLRNKIECIAKEVE